jgi:rRNA maturation endonuclease Nob1
MSVKRCLKCNEDLPAKAKFCSECGGAAYVLVERESNTDSHFTSPAAAPASSVVCYL